MNHGTSGTFTTYAIPLASPMKQKAKQHLVSPMKQKAKQHLVSPF
jgi:hypothetical protein